MGLYLWTIAANALSLSVLMAGAWHRDEVESILRPVSGTDTILRMQRWRWCFLATAGLFGHADGSEWGVSHSRMKAES
jgi:hypothetical protein